MQVTLDWGNIIVVVMGGLLGLVWNTLRAQIDERFRTLKDSTDAQIKALTEKQNRTDNALSRIPDQFEKVVDQLRRIELQLSSNYPTKSEVKDLENCVQRLSEQMARLYGEEGRTAVPIKRGTNKR